jgi:hypothetical protein
MIYVSKQQLKQVEYLIGQSIQGNHVLFDNEVIRRVFDAEDEPENPPERPQRDVEIHIERMILEPTIERKREFLRKLDPRLYRRVVRTYFNIVENNLFEANGVRH